MAHVLRFLYCWLSIEKLLIIDSVADIIVDSEVANAEAGQVLEEVCTLARVYTVICQPSLNDDLGGRNMRPLDWHAQPRVAAAPSARTNEDIIASLIEEAPVDALYLVGNGRIVRCGIPIGLDVDAKHAIRKFIKQ